MLRAVQKVQLTEVLTREFSICLSCFSAYPLQKLSSRICLQLQGKRTELNRGPLLSGINTKGNIFTMCYIGPLISWFLRRNDVVIVIENMQKAAQKG